MADTSNRRSASPVALSRPITPPTSATIRVSPSEFTFQTSKTHPQVLVGRVSLRIVAADAPIGFKFKTNAPDRYSVRPVLGVLSPLGESVEIFARCEGAIQPDDRFMIESITLTEEEAQQFDSKKQWKSFDRRRIVENFIHCRMPSQPSSSNSSTTSFHTVSLAPNTNASWSTSASPRVRGHLSHSRAPSLELPMSRRSNHNNTNHATSNAAAAVQRSASPSRRSLVVGNRVSHHSYAGSDVEADLDNDEKRERTNRYSMNSVVIRKQQQQHYSMSRHPVDKGLVDLLPQILIFLLACVIVTFWLPISRWIGALLLPLFGHGNEHLGDHSLHTGGYDTNTNGIPTTGNPLVMAHA